MRLPTAPVPGAILMLCLLLVATLPRPADAASPAARDFAAVMMQTPDPARGGATFDTCAACHGSQGEGASDGTVPAIGGQHLSVVAWALVRYRHGNRLDPRMRHFVDRHHLATRQDIADVAAYVSGLNPMHTAPQGRPADGADAASGTRVAEVYAARCSACHGERGQGDGLRRHPRLAGQQYGYLLYRLGATPEDRTSDLVRDRVHAGRLPPASDLPSLCGYLSRLTP